MLPSGALSHDQRFYMVDYYTDSDTTYKLWPSLTVGQLRSMIYSGRVDVQNHSVSHTRLGEFDTESSESRQALRMCVLPCNEFIKKMFGVEPIAFTPPFLSYASWQESWFNTWFKYWVGSLATPNNWSSNIQTADPPPQKLKALEIDDSVISTYGWSWLPSLLTHLETNKDLAILLTHDILWDNVPSEGRNINPKNYKILMDYLEPIRKAGHLIGFRDLPDI